LKRNLSKQITNEKKNIKMIQINNIYRN